MFNNNFINYKVSENSNNQKELLSFNRDYAYFDNIGKIVFNSLDKKGIEADDKNYVIDFFNKNVVIADQVDCLMKKIDAEFGEKTEIYFDSDKDSKEISLNIKTKKNVEDSVKSLIKLDSWFVPHIYDKNQKFTINLDF